MHPLVRILVFALLAIGFGSLAHADSFEIDVSRLALTYECPNGTRHGVNRVCLKVTNDDENEAEGDHEKPIKSVYLQFRLSSGCGFWHPSIEKPDTWDADSGVETVPLAPLSERYRNWVHWQTDDPDACLDPGESSAEPFCVTMVGTPEVYLLSTDTGDFDGDEFNDLLAEIDRGGDDVSDVNDDDFRTDTDQDGIVDEDETRSDPAKSDSDDDGFPDASDNCPEVDNPDQTDTDGDGLGDACDPHPEEKDGDLDRLDDGRETVTGTDVNKADSDNDDHLDVEEIEGGSDPNDPESVPEMYADGLDNDGYGLIDENFDEDEDGVDSLHDNCARTPNVPQADIDGDGQGDVCDLDDGVLLFTEIEGESVAWQSDPLFFTYNLYRGSLIQLFETGVYAQAPGSTPCAAWFCDLPGPSFIDDFDPLPGQACYWLVTGNDLGGIEHGLGATSAGDERPLGPSCHR